MEEVPGSFSEGSKRLGSHHCPSIPLLLPDEFIKPYFPVVILRKTSGDTQYL